MITASKANLPIRQIPQEAASREGIFAVCFCFLFSIAAHITNLPLWVSIFVVVALGWRCLQNIGLLKPVNKWLLLPMVLFGGLSVFAQYWTIVGRDAGLALLTVMATFKIIESRSHRDLLILIFLCYFLIATHFLFSQSIFTAILMLITLVVITTTLITLNQRNASVSIKERLTTSARLVTTSIPLMLILFILVPRIPGPLWGITNEQRGGITGLSNEMSPGAISNLIRSNEVAFRVEFEGDLPGQQQLYWRGPVMSAFNGRRWFLSRRPKISSFEAQSLHSPVKYTVTLEPNGEHWLLALDIPTQLVADSFMTAEFQLTSRKAVNDLRRYSLESHLISAIGLKEDPEYLELTSRYPRHTNQRSIEYGQQLAARFDNKADIIDHVLRQFREQEYTYTLSPPLLRDNVVDRFLFDSKRGFCEHFAGSFAFLMRAAGIPSRIVTGYQGGEFNEDGGYLIVRQSDAHAWTEVWLENRGWLRIDPTAAVSPSRIEQGLDDALSGENENFRIKNRNPLFGNFLFKWDSLQHQWNDWVINYDDTRQKRFLNDLDIGIENTSDMIIAMVILLASVTGGFWFFSWYRERPPSPERYELDFRRFLKKMAGVGYQKSHAEDARQFLHRVTVDDTHKMWQIEAVVNRYYAIKYGDKKSSAQLNELTRLVNSIQV